MKRKIIGVFCLIAMLLLSGCSEWDKEPESSSGAKKVTVDVQVDASGRTVEQNNVAGRLLEDNKPGAIKHLYIISAYSGQVILYSTVQGKVTSSGKRLTPLTVANEGEYTRGFYFDVGGDAYETQEVMQDDGTYGSSVEYLFWWDTKDIYHQHYVSGGQIIHVSYINRF